MKLKPIWLYHHLRSDTKKAVLLELMEQIPNELLPDMSISPARNVERIEFIRKARRRYDEQQASDKPGLKRGKLRDPACEITADECNKWLRSLKQ